MKSGPPTPPLPHYAAPSLVLPLSTHRASLKSEGSQGLHYQLEDFGERALGVMGPLEPLVSWGSASVAKSWLLPLTSLQETRQHSGRPCGAGMGCGAGTAAARPRPRAELRAAVLVQPGLPCVGRWVPKLSQRKIGAGARSTVWLSRQEQQG